MQDLNNLPNTPEEDEAMDALAKLGGNVDLKAVFTQMGQDLTQPTVTKEEFMEYGMNNPISISPTTQDILNNMAIPQAPEPQPSGENPHNEQPNLEDVLQNIAEQFALLYTVIRKEKLQGNSQPNTTPPEGNQSLQECVSLTLQQADWFKEMVRGIIDDTYDFADYAENAVEHVVEKEVEHYFDSSFNPEDHFDFGDAVSDAVDDRIDDIVSDKIDDAVDSYLSNATISISK
jgi:hypothetical protein